MVTESNIPCRVQPCTSAMCQQRHKLKLKTNLLVSLVWKAASDQLWFALSSCIGLW